MSDDLFGKSEGADGPEPFTFVYLLQSLDGHHFYSGMTGDLEARIQKHNAGSVPHTAKFKPWRLRTYFAFSDAQLAQRFEKYLKSGSGRAFAKMHF